MRLDDIPHGLSVADSVRVAAACALTAHRAGTDMGEWHALVGSTAAASLPGGVDRLLANRAGSWEADLLSHLVRGTVGWGDEALDRHRDPALVDWWSRCP